MLTWKQNFKWKDFPMSKKLTSSDKNNEVFLTLTDSSYYEDGMIFNLCSVKPFPKFHAIWHKKLTIYTVLRNHYVENYVLVRGKRIYIDEMLKTLNKKDWRNKNGESTIWQC